MQPSAVRPRIEQARKALAKMTNTSSKSDLEVISAARVVAVAVREYLQHVLGLLHAARRPRTRAAKAQQHQDSAGVPQDRDGAG